MVESLEPDGPSLEGLQLTGLIGHINPESLGLVVARALNHRGDVSADIRRELDSAIRDSVNVRGFKNSERAPAVKLKEPVLRQLPYSESLFSTVLKTWAASHTVLMDAVSTHLQSRGMTVANPDFAQRRLRSYWPVDDWRFNQDAIIEVHGEFDKGEVALMLCYVAGRMPVHPHDTWEEVEPSGDLAVLNQFRSYLEELSPDAPLWESDLPDFIESVKEILDAKTIERQSAASRRSFNAMVNEFVNQYSSSRLEWLGLARDSWVPPSDLSSFDASEVQARLKTLGNLIDDYEATPVDGPSMDESQRLMAQRSQILQRIRETKFQLDRMLAAERGPDGPPFDGDGQELASQTPIEETNDEATLLRLDVSDGVLDFSPETVRYDMDLESDIERLIVTPVATDSRAAIEVAIESPGGERHLIECSDGAFHVPLLNALQTVVSVRVITQDDKAVQTYTLSATRAALSDIALSNIHLSDGEIAFDPLVGEYGSAVANGVDSLTITPTLSNPHAALRVTASDEAGNVVVVSPLVGGGFKILSLPVGQTLVSIAVLTEEHSVSNTYSIALTRIGSSDASLKSLHISTGIFDFDSTQTDYAVDLPADVDDLDIFARPTHEGATVTATVQLGDRGTSDNLDSQDGAFHISGIEDGRSAIRLSIASEDNRASQTYVIFVTKHARESTDLEQLLWSLVGEDDIAGAYWLARSLESAQLESPVPPSLLMAVQGARWLSPVSDIYVEDLASIVSEVGITNDDDVEVLLGLAASLRSALVAPETNLLAWLSSPKCLPEVEEIVSVVRDFANRGYALRPEFASRPEEDQPLQTLIHEASMEARAWLAEARQHHTKFARANNVWQYLCSDGLLSVILKHAVDDNREHVGIVRNNLSKLDHDGSAIEAINGIDRSLLGNSAPRTPIAGAARTWLLRRMREATSRAMRWCDLVERETATQRQEGHWLLNQVVVLREHLQLQSPQVFDALLRLSTDPNPPAIVASARCAARSFCQLNEYLNVSLQPDQLPIISPITEDLQSIGASINAAREEDSRFGLLQATIARRLLWIPSFDLNDSCLPSNETQLAEWPSNSLSLEDAIRLRIDNDDFRFFDLISSSVALDRLVGLRDLHARELKAAQDTLRYRIAEVRENVNQATNDGVIEYEGAQWNAFVSQLDDIDADQALNFRSIHDSLERIIASVNEDRARRREELIGEWKELSARFSEDADANTEFLAALTDTFALASSLASPDIRVMEDCVSGLRNYRSAEHSVLFLPPWTDQRSGLEEFLTFTSSIADPQSYTTDSKGLRNLLRQLGGEA